MAVVNETLARKYFPDTDPIGRLELAFELVDRAEALEAKLRAADQGGALHGASDGERHANAVAHGLLGADDVALLGEYRRLRRGCIMVDDFPRDIGRHEASPGLDGPVSGHQDPDKAVVRLRSA